MKTLTAALLLCLASPLAAEDPKTKPCSGPEFRQFDFWAGDWDTFEVDDAKTVVARGTVKSILDDCVLLETYEGADGLVGQSFSIYDSARKLWSHTWVTNRGQLVVLEGGLQGDRMVLTGSELSARPSKHLRAVWRVADGGVRETAEISADQGRTWKPLFDIVFRRRASSSAPASR
jgi:hypothetical protein